MSETPGWMKNTTLIWIEDDAHPPDGEKVGEAWQRFFGEVLNDNVSVERAGGDGDDWVAFRYKNGIIINSCGNLEIRVEPGSPWFDWTRDETGLSNSGKEFKLLAKWVTSLLLQNGGTAIDKGWADMQGHLIMAQLAHHHSLRPVKPPERKLPK